ICEGKHQAALRHGGRAAAIFRRLMMVQDCDLKPALGISLAALADQVKQPRGRRTGTQNAKNIVSRMKNFSVFVHRIIPSARDGAE
ncbi:hypothetical protein RCCGE510_33439, partial [Rhizobium sp. CCGE 510]